MGNDCFKPREPERRHSEAESKQSHISGLETPSERVKFLLLGAGESGKTTLFKQMKLNYLKSYTKSSLEAEMQTIVSSVIHVFYDFMEVLKSLHGAISEDPLLVEAEEVLFPKVPVLQTAELPTAFFPKLTEFMKDIWTSDWGVDLWKNFKQYSIVDCLEYFMEDIDRISQPMYTPTEMDFLKSRVRTNGVHEQTFEYKGVTILVVDVGGQRSERRKWIQCFDGVTAVMFVAAISEFDHHVLFEDTSSYRLEEAIDLFRKTLGFFIFKNTPFILFLNKRDLLQEKIAKMEEDGENLDEFFPTLKLGTNYKNAGHIVEEYLRNKFMAVVPPEKLERIYPQVVTATDRNAFRHVFAAATAIVLKESVQQSFVEKI